MRIHQTSSFSTSPQTIIHAERLLAIAEERMEDSIPLLGCSILLLATALEQSLTTTLKGLSLHYDAAELWDLSNQAADLQDKSLWFRLKATPEILVNPFTLNPRSETVCFLRDVVTRRNALVHIEEEPISFEIELPDNLEGPLNITHEITKEQFKETFESNPWNRSQLLK